MKKSRATRGKKKKEKKTIEEETGPAKRRKLVKKILNAAEKNVGKDSFKVSANEIIKLIELEKQMDTEELKEVEVKWVGESKESDASKK
ncbi:MAG: hypothetical protein HYZ37_10175 [Candidatus Solibacter usitatus]|nr:hypothetical protein [Candidatus Solibacter usitatus]